VGQAQQTREEFPAGQVPGGPEQDDDVGVQQRRVGHGLGGGSGEVLFRDGGHG
jgi:hypothetical protein